jgi:hypothetical protein
MEPATEGQKKDGMACAFQMRWSATCITTGAAVNAVTCEAIKGQIHLFSLLSLLSE